MKNVGNKFLTSKKLLLTLIPTRWGDSLDFQNHEGCIIKFNLEEQFIDEFQTMVINYDP